MDEERDFSDGELERYARHLVLPEIGEAGQAKLLDSRVLVIGAGGLGSPLLLYLAAAGVGTLGVVDDDAVDLSNLQRQVIHGEAEIGAPKVASAARRLKAINPDVRVEEHRTRLTAANALALVSAYDLVCDGSDNFATRYLANDACHLAGRSLVTAAIMRFDGQLTTLRSHRGHGSDGAENPCYRCLFGEQPEDPKQSCADVGVLGALAGTMGALQAVEAVKELLGIGRSLAGRLLLYDALEAGFRTIRAKADPDCPLCGARPSIGSLSDLDYRPDAAVCAAE
ncbi:adenylyltransferase and sulfurtransferase [Tistlia consotensis]|uniref:Molybdopterin-synthase adenylyltransferase n=1 Tax=Tistlia consotensis USBA 355 TaxID=560819 RepID=A0A1Y6B631_9PROT|nr:molybdopterin-synthase adenylyltransferase MoeB [Tistlia consotensis]SME94057.1 adenylyltransferase and sulfurtransferase [Tistlia consotensis USBA 355]SNR29031.1 adenylyltransferase and sulfurtransferase [Tistlia consotensis]